MVSVIWKEFLDNNLDLWGVNLCLLLVQSISKNVSLMIITSLVESSADMMYRAAHAGVPEYENTGDNLRGGAHGNDPFRHPTQDLHGDVRADCRAPVVENVGWGMLGGYSYIVLLICRLESEKMNAWDVV